MTTIEDVVDILDDLDDAIEDLDVAVNALDDLDADLTGLNAAIDTVCAKTRRVRRTLHKTQTLVESLREKPECL